MINTVNTKQQQLENGYFKIGTGNTVILIIGSCRSVPYVQYLSDWNEANNSPFTVCFIDPYNWCFDLQDNRVNLEEKIISLETDERLLRLFANTDTFIHEFYSHFGMFNCDKLSPKNVYQFGLNPKLEICIPNWNNEFVLFADIVTFDSKIREMAIADYNVIGKLSPQTQDKIKSIADAAINRFYTICLNTDLPEMQSYFENNFRDKRLFWSSNHVSKWFTLAVFKLMNDKFLHLDLSKGFDEGHTDLYAHGLNTPLTEWDELTFGYRWNEEVILLRSKL